MGNLRVLVKTKNKRRAIDVFVLKKGLCKKRIKEYNKNCKILIDLSTIMNDEISTKIALFKGKEIRKMLHQGEWWFSVIDVVQALTDSSNPNDYWYKMKIRVKDED